jgi:4-alpha-glucanotransferase
MNQQAAGILLHPSSLSNRYTIGDLSPAATGFAEALAESGPRWWKMLPIGLTGGENSLYQSMFAFGGHPLLAKR